jgi:hypothetical protein
VTDRADAPTARQIRGSRLVPLAVPHYVELRRVSGVVTLTLAAELPPVRGWTLEPAPVLPPRPSPVPAMIVANLDKARDDLAEARRRVMAGDLAPLERDVDGMIEAAESR